MTLSHSSAIYGSNFKCFFRGNNRELKQRTFITVTYVNCKLLLSSGGVAVPGVFKDGHEGRPASTQANCKTLFTWSGGPRSSGGSFFCFVSPRACKQKKPTPLGRGPPLHVNRP